MAIKDDGKRRRHGVRQRSWPRHYQWQHIVHRGAQALSIGALLVVVVVVYRSWATGSAEPGEIVNRHPALLILSLLVMAMAGAVAVLRPEQGNVPRLVKTMIAWSLALAAGIVLAWAFAGSAVRSDQWIGTPVLNEEDVAVTLAEHRSPPEALTPSLLVPTGVMIQSLEFLGTNNVQITGYVWQQYDSTIPDDIEQGITFPETIGDEYRVEEAYRVDQQGGELIGWYFSATFRQSFDYSRYPFDRQDVWLRLWHPNAERGVLLVPDFGAYLNPDPMALPGIEERFVYSGWDPLDSGFSYVDQRYSTTFGFDTGVDEDALPELYFNFALKRVVFGSFLSQILYAGTAALLLFLILVLTTSDAALHTRFQMSTSAVLATTSALFFAVVFEHDQVREAIGQQDVAYLETLPLLFYVFIPLVAVNAIVLASPWEIRFITYRHNLIPKLLYWPTLLGLLLVITLAVHFR